MGFFIAMFLCNLLMPSIMVIAGYCMYKNPPKEINGLIGYRTAMSEKNKNTWAFAHDYCGKLWIKSGIILLVPTVLVQIPFAKSGEDVVDLCREYDAKKVILYGSRAKGTAGERSDIDIAVSGVAEFDELLEKVEELPNCTVLIY